uniref:Protein krueppel n=1 Tax=Clastoptera arizonana TaxID=38151 RepID=A0A1B6BWN3_9HEMI
MSEVGKSKEKLKDKDFMKGKTKICRICMLGCIKGFISLFTVCDGPGKIYDKIMDVCNIMITSDDGLPKWICYSCLVHLETSYQFKMQAEKSDKLLRQQLTMEDSPSEMNDVYIIDKDDLIKHNSGVINQTTFLQNILTRNNSSNATFSDPSISTHPRVESNDVEQSSDLVIPDDVNIETSNELNSIQITNVVSQAPIEEVEMPSSGDIDKKTYNSSEKIDDPLQEPLCTCAESGTSTTKCASCFKISRVGTPEDISYSSSFKSREEIMNDDQIIREVCEKLVLTVELCSRNHVNTISRVATTEDVNYCNHNKSKEEILSGKIANEVCEELILNVEMSSTDTIKMNDTILSSYESEVRGENYPYSTGVMKCDLCCKFFMYQKFLEKHYAFYHAGYKPYKCDICEYVTHIKHNLIRHKRSAHFKIRPYVCLQCQKRFFSQKALLRHIDNHNFEFKCDQCDQLFGNKGSLSTHKKKHLDVEKYNCKHCGKGFRLKQECNKHEDSHGLECTLCYKKFNSGSGLKAHIKNVHNDLQKTFVCETCGQSFNCKGNLTQHRYTHGEEVECDLCNKKYPHRNALSVHKRFVHVKKKPLECNLCGKKFRHKQTLKTHLDTHADGKKYQCRYCNVKFTQRAAIKTHMKGVHMGIEPYICEICFKSFKWKSTFYKHKSVCVRKI